MSLKSLVPHPLRSAFHYVVAHTSALIHAYPSRDMIVIGITGTKGKTSTSEMLASIFQAAGKKVALINSIRIGYNKESKKNPVGRSMPGRGFLQKFLSEAKKKGCEVAIIEMTSEGARQHRHRAIDLDALVFLNLAPEHIEAHGSYEAYSDAKFELGLSLARSSKRPRIMVANARDRESERYLALGVEHAIPFDINAHAHDSSPDGGTLQWNGEVIRISFPGDFSLENALAAAETARAFGISATEVARGLSQITKIPGRAEYVDEGQDFAVVVDYAHTPDSLLALTRAYDGKRKICVLGSAGGGRDTWKRPVLGKIAEEHCDTVILSNDAPYDEDPKKIIEEIRSGMSGIPTIIPDRREAIRTAISLARTDDVVLLTGMGVDTIVDGEGRSLDLTDIDVARIALKERLHSQV